MPRWLIFSLLLLGLTACSKPLDLPAVPVAAADPGDYTRFRADLSARFPAERLQPLDTAMQELELDAMARNIPTAEARKLDALAVAHGKTVQAVTLLGWRARCARFQREIATLQELIDSDRKLDQTPGITARIKRAQDVITKLQSDLATAERQLAAYAATAP